MKLPGRGTRVELHDGEDPGDFTKLGQVISWNDVGESLETEDVTDDDSAGYRERIGTLLDSGEFSVQIHFDPGDGTHDPATGLMSIQRAREVRKIGFVFSDDAETRWEFPALVTNVRVSHEIAGKIVGNVSFAGSGAADLDPS